MTLQYSKHSKVAMDKTEYIQNKILAYLPKAFNSTAVIPAANHLFEVDENCLKLDSKKSELCHHITAQLLFFAKQGRPGLLTGVEFLTTRLKYTGNDDYKKLQQVVKYLPKYL